MTNEEIEKYVIVCDESTRHGSLYSYFLGGAIVKESDYDYISEELSRLKHILVLKEIKRHNIDESNAEKYKQILDVLFGFVRQGKIRLRVMFCNNNLLIPNIKGDKDTTFNKFYYFFLRYAFGLRYSKENISLRIIFDELPDKISQNDEFKKNLIEHLNLREQGIFKNRVYLKREDIAEVDSKKHIILQCVDVIVGLMDYFCNSYISESYIKTKKEKGRYLVLRHLLEFIYDEHPSFDIFITTPNLLHKKGWNMSYAHYLYKPSRQIKRKFKRSDFNYIKKDPLFSTSTNRDQLSPSKNKES